MNSAINIFLIAVAFVVAVEKVGFSFLKKRDRQNGLYLNDSSYTLWGTARLLFLKPEKRIRKETEESFQDFLDKNTNRKKRIEYAAVGYCGLLFLCIVTQVFFEGVMSGIDFINISLFAIGISFAITKRGILIFAIVGIGLLSCLSEESWIVIFRLIPFLAGIGVTFVFLNTRLLFRKRIRKMQT